MFDELRRICFEITHGLYWLVKTGWNNWASLFDTLPYGNPYIAAVAVALLFVVLHWITSLFADVDELQLAAATLLTEVALSDGNFDDSKRAAIVGIVGSRFRLSRSQARRLVAAAERTAADATHLVRFTQVIKDNFVPDERVEMIEMIWTLVYDNGVVHNYEDTLLRSIAGLIYVSDRDRGEARKRVLARLAIDDPE